MESYLGLEQSPFTYTDDEKGRLERQHTAILKSSQLLFHPSLGDLSQFRCILDCTAGSLVWAADLLAGGNSLVKNQPVHLRPDCVVEACDVDPRTKHGPVPKGLSRIFTRQLQAPFGQDCVGRYDLVNEHFHIGCIKRDEWLQALRHLKTILKPGGILNLRESSARWPTPSPAPHLRKLETLMDKLWDLAGYHTTLADDLPKLVQEAGFVDVQVLRTPWPIGAAGKHLGSQYVADSLENFRLLLGHDGLALSALAYYGTESGLPTPEQVKRITDGAYNEVKTIGADHRTVLIVAKKPK